MPFIKETRWRTTTKWIIGLIVAAKVLGFALLIALIVTITSVIQERGLKEVLEGIWYGQQINYE